MVVYFIALGVIFVTEIVLCFIRFPDERDDEEAEYQYEEIRPFRFTIGCPFAYLPSCDLKE